MRNTPTPSPKLSCISRLALTKAQLAATQQELKFAETACGAAVLENTQLKQTIADLQAQLKAERLEHLSTVAPLVIGAERNSQ